MEHEPNLRHVRLPGERVEGTDIGKALGVTWTTEDQVAYEADLARIKEVEDEAVRRSSEIYFPRA